MFKNKAMLGASAAIVLLGAFSANAQKAPPVTGEANDHTSAGAVTQPAGKMSKRATNNVMQGQADQAQGEKGQGQGTGHR